MGLTLSIKGKEKQLIKVSRQALCLNNALTLAETSNFKVDVYADALCVRNRENKHFFAIVNLQLWR